MDRRSLLIAAALMAAPAYALARALRDRAPGDRRLSARRWIERQQELAHGLRGGLIDQGAWHDEVNRLASEVDVAQLMAESSIGPANEPFMRDPVKRRVRFLGDDGRPRKLDYGAATFTFGPESVITPHAHEHMVSAHMVVAGKVRIRTYDRIGREGESLIIRPTADHVGEPGSGAAMTSAHDNVHWFTPVTSAAMTFDVIIDGLDRGSEDYVIQPIDPLRGTHRADGTIVAPIISFEESMTRYSARV